MKAKIPRDALGRPIQVNDWVMGEVDTVLQLHRVLAVDVETGILRLQRLVAKQLEHCWDVHPVMRPISRSGRFVIVSPPEPVLALFCRICGGTGTAKDYERAGLWLRGDGDVLP